MFRAVRGGALAVMASRAVRAGTRRCYGGAVLSLARCTVAACAGWRHPLRGSSGWGWAGVAGFADGHDACCSRLASARVGVLQLRSGGSDAVSVANVPAPPTV